MRYAIYFAPMPGTALHRLGSSWLGRDAHTGESLAQPDVEDLARLTAHPRRYGFHATLKPPFALREGLAPDALMRACAALSADMTGFRVMLRAGHIDGFLALIPDGDPARLDALAARAVRDLDGFRQPPEEEELARRRKAPLTARQDVYLQQWGYPYVFEDFRFHMTLTERLDPGALDRIFGAAQAHFAEALAEPVMIGGLTLFQEPEPGAPLLALRHLPFTRSTDEAAA